MTFQLWYMICESIDYVTLWSYGARRGNTLFHFSSVWRVSKWINVVSNNFLQVYYNI
jgi:hypothetical protein